MGSKLSELGATLKTRRLKFLLRFGSILKILFLLNLIFTKQLGLYCKLFSKPFIQSFYCLFYLTQVKCLIGITFFVTIRTPSNKGKIGILNPTFQKNIHLFKKTRDAQLSFYLSQFFLDHVLDRYFVFHSYLKQVKQLVDEIF